MEIRLDDSRRHADVIAMFMSSSSTPFRPPGPRPKAVRRDLCLPRSGKRGARAQPWPQIAKCSRKTRRRFRLGRLSDTCADKLDGGGGQGSWVATWLGLEKTKKGQAREDPPLSSYRLTYVL